MTIERTTLRCIERIRRNKVPNEYKSLISSFGADVLRFAFKTYKISSSRAYLYSRNAMQIQYRKICGEQDIWQKIADSDVLCRNLSGGYYSFPVLINDDLNHKIRFVVGYIAIYRKTQLTSQEYESIRIILDFIGDYIKYAIKNDRVSRTIKLYINLDSEILSEKLPGTILSKGQTKLHRAFSACVSCFCLYDNGYIYDEYLKNMSLSNAIKIKTRKYIIEPDFQTIIENNNFYTNKVEKDSFIYKLFLKWNKNKDADVNVYISVIKNDNKPICIWFIFICKNVIQFSHEIKDFFLYFNTKVGKNYNYLYQRRIAKLIVDPHFISRDTRVVDNRVFILMPFTLPWSDRIWNQVIKPTVQSNGLEALRADDLYGHDIMEDIWTSILQSRIIIADITSRNPNVFYELGIAHAIGKDVILLTQNVNDIPFDLNRYRHIVYEDNLDGCEVLKKGLHNTILDIIKKK